MLTIAEATAAVLEATPVLAPERVALERALGRVLAEEVRSDGPLPPFDSSAMDGYAARSGPAAELAVAGESRAGHPAARPLGDGEAMIISTGAQIPDGADCVVPVEHAQSLGMDRVRLPDRPVGANVRRAGDDVGADQPVLPAGVTLEPAEVAVLASLGHAEVLCGRRPRVAVLVTGDELIAPGEPLGPGQIRDSNAFALAGQAERAGADVVHRAIVRDEPEATVAALAAALDAADVVCVSGGVSVGPHDHVKPALARLGVRERFWRVALKPGKPTWFGTRGETLVFGLPGNPVSAMVTFHLFARPALRRQAGGDAADRRATAVLDVAVARQPGRDQVLRGRLEARDDGWHVVPTRAQGSHVLTSMVGADAFALVPAGDGEVAAGERVAVELLF